MTLPKYAVVTVTFNPELELLRRQLARVGPASAVIVVDNASTGAVISGLRQIAAGETRRVLLEQSRNLGLAAGLNVGAREALEHVPDCEYLVFLDQDTEPEDGAMQRLIEGAAALRKREPAMGLVGPMMIDDTTGLEHGIHVIEGWRWSRVFPRAGQTEPVTCAGVNGSGMVVPVAIFRELGGFEEDLFIDQVDTEFSFRVAHAGHRLYTLPDARFAHRMGQRSLRFWLGRWRVWPYRSPERHYYLFRNAVRLLRRPYPPRVWKLWAVPKLLLTTAMHALLDRERGAQLRGMWAGIRAGFDAETVSRSTPTDA